MRRIGLVAAIVCVLGGSHVHAVITAKTPLTVIEGDALYIFVGKVEKYFPERPAMMVKVVEDIKGRAPFRQIPINCKVADEKAFRENQIAPLLKRFGQDAEIIFFVNRLRGKTHITFAYTNGTWFQVFGTRTGEKDEVVFALRSAEPYFRKSFKGTNDELLKLLKDHAAGKAKLPAIDDKVEPGFGPEYKAKGAFNLSPQRQQGEFALLALRAPHLAPGGQLFAVIPTIGIGAPLAILALLFPTVFGGVFVLFRQWMAFITLISLNSTLLLLHFFFAPSLLRGSWWANASTLWLIMTVFTFVCAFWAWRRQLNLLSDGEQEVPQKTELSVLAFMAGTCLITTIVLWYFTNQLSWTADVGFPLTLVMTLGILAGALYKGWRASKKVVPFGSMPLATEGVILCVMLLGHVVFVPAIWGSNVNTEGAIEQGGKTEAKPVDKKWVFTADVKGMFASSPLIDGDSIYASYSEINQYATMVKLDRHTGLKKWEFIGKNDDLRQLISTPCIADGKLYFGEGFHDDKNCRVFCVDAEKGTEVWSFKTGGQTESSPAVAKGKVYIGAGNDGVYCLDAKTGKEIWKYPGKDYKGRLLRFGGGIVVIGNRLYCGTGVDRNEKKDKGESATFCLEADTGKLIWKTPAPYPIWSTPLIKDGLIYVSSGNGDVYDDVPPPDVPGGTLQCLDEKTGNEKWSIKLPNGVIEAPAIDGHRIYFGCRDGQVYCVNRADGKERWRRFLDTPVIGTPVLDTDAVGERSFGVFVTATGGKVCCLNAQNGDIVWMYNLTQQQAYISTAPRLIVTRTPNGFQRRLYFGCGIGGGPRDITANRPVFYCLEDMQ